MWDWLQSVLNFLGISDWPDGDEEGCDSQADKWDDLVARLEDVKRDILSARSLAFEGFIDGNYHDQLAPEMVLAVAHVNRQISNYQALSSSLRQHAKNIRDKKKEFWDTVKRFGIETLLALGGGGLAGLIAKSLLRAALRRIISQGVKDAAIAAGRSAEAALAIPKPLVTVAVNMAKVAPIGIAAGAGGGFAANLGGQWANIRYGLDDPTTGQKQTGYNLGALGRAAKDGAIMGGIAGPLLQVPVKIVASPFLNVPQKLVRSVGANTAGAAGAELVNTGHVDLGKALATGVAATLTDPFAMKDAFSHPQDTPAPQNHPEARPTPSDDGGPGPNDPPPNREVSYPHEPASAAEAPSRTEAPARVEDPAAFAGTAGVHVAAGAPHALTSLHDAKPSTVAAPEQARQGGQPESVNRTPPADAARPPNDPPVSQRPSAHQQAAALSVTSSSLSAGPEGGPAAGIADATASGTPRTEVPMQAGESVSGLAEHHVPTTAGSESDVTGSAAHALDPNAAEAGLADSGAVLNASVDSAVDPAAIMRGPEMPESTIAGTGTTGTVPAVERIAPEKVGPGAEKPGPVSERAVSAHERPAPAAEKPPQTPEKPTHTAARSGIPTEKLAAATARAGVVGDKPESAEPASATPQSRESAATNDVVQPGRDDLGPDSPDRLDDSSQTSSDHGRGGDAETGVQATDPGWRGLPDHLPEDPSRQSECLEEAASRAKDVNESSAAERNRVQQEINDLRSELKDARNASAAQHRLADLNDQLASKKTELVDVDNRVHQSRELIRSVSEAEHLAARAEAERGFPPTDGMQLRDLQRAVDQVRPEADAQRALVDRLLNERTLLDAEQRRAAEAGDHERARELAERRNELKSELDEASRQLRYTDRELLQLGEAEKLAAWKHLPAETRVEKLAEQSVEAESRRADRYREFVAGERAWDALADSRRTIGEDAALRQLRDVQAEAKAARDADLDSQVRARDAEARQQVLDSWRRTDPDHPWPQRELMTPQDRAATGWPAVDMQGAGERYLPQGGEGLRQQWERQWRGLTQLPAEMVHKMMQAFHEDGVRPARDDNVSARQRFEEIRRSALLDEAVRLVQEGRFSDATKFIDQQVAYEKSRNAATHEPDVAGAGPDRIPRNMGQPAMGDAWSNSRLGGMWGVDVHRGGTGETVKLWDAIDAIAREQIAAGRGSEPLDIGYRNFATESDGVGGDLGPAPDSGPPPLNLNRAPEPAEPQRLAADDVDNTVDRLEADRTAAQESATRQDLRNVHDQAEAVRKQWEELSPEQRKAVLEHETQPGHRTKLGDLDGLSGQVRDALNRHNLVEDMVSRHPEQAQQIRDFARAMDEHLASPREVPRPGHFNPTADKPSLLNRVASLFNDNAPYKNVDATWNAVYGPDATTGPQRQLLIYDPSAFHGDGRIAVAVGNIDAAHVVSVHTPGITSTIRSIEGNVTNATNHHIYANESRPNQRNAVVAWIGYDAPSGAGLARTPSDHLARQGGARLAHDVAGLAGTRGDGVRINLFGHSYGSTTTAFAGVHGRLADYVATVTLLGSPGAGPLSHARDFGIGSENVYVASNSHDLVTWLGGSQEGHFNRISGPLHLGGLGFDPAMRDFGATRIAAEYVSPQHTKGLITAHVNYFSTEHFSADGTNTPLRVDPNARPTESLANFTHISTGDTHRVTLETPDPRTPTPVGRDQHGRVGPSHDAAAYRTADPPSAHPGAPDPAGPPGRPLPDDASGGEPTPNRPDGMDGSGVHRGDIDGDGGGWDPARGVIEGPAAARAFSESADNTEAGAAFFDRGDTTMREAANAVEQVRGEFTVDVHGDRDGVLLRDGAGNEYRLSAREFAEVIRSQTNWDGHSPIRLLSCDTGAGGHPFARDLARELGVDVIAPDRPVWTYPDGREPVVSGFERGPNNELRPRIPPDGAWKRFTPDGGVEPVRGIGDVHAGRTHDDSGAGRDQPAGVDRSAETASHEGSLDPTGDQPGPPSVGDRDGSQPPEGLDLPAYEPGSLSNAETRTVYTHGELRMAELEQRWARDGVPLEERAHRMFEMRNELREWARTLMADREAAAHLTANEKMMTWDRLVEKTTGKGFSGDEVFREIIDSSTRSRGAVNAALGIDPHNPPPLPPHPRVDDAIPRGDQREDSGENPAERESGRDQTRRYIPDEPVAGIEGQHPPLTPQQKAHDPGYREKYYDEVTTRHADDDGSQTSETSYRRKNANQRDFDGDQVPLIRLNESGELVVVPDDFVRSLIADGESDVHRVDQHADETRRQLVDQRDEDVTVLPRPDLGSSDHGDVTEHRSPPWTDEIHSANGEVQHVPREHVEYHYPPGTHPDFPDADVRVVEVRVGENSAKFTVVDGIPVQARFSIGEVFDRVDRPWSEVGAQRDVGAGDGHDAGHMMGFRFGLDEGLANLFEQHANFNRSAYLRMENEWADWIRNGGRVDDVTVNLTGDPPSIRPDAVNVEYHVYNSAGDEVHANRPKFSNSAGQTFERLPLTEIRIRLGA